LKLILLASISFAINISLKCNIVNLFPNCISRFVYAYVLLANNKVVFLSFCTSINSKWIKDLNIRLKTLQLVQERAGNILEAIGIGKDFLSRTPAAQ
jgi:hypothetical protein